MVDLNMLKILLFREKNRGLPKQKLSTLYQAMNKEERKVYDDSKSEGVKVKRTYIRCSLDKFLRNLAMLPDSKRDIIKDTPFVNLLQLEKKGVHQIDTVVKTLARDFNCEEMKLRVQKGGESQEFSVTPDDFSTIMGIQNGSGAVVESPHVDSDLVKKFCKLEDGIYEDICPKRIQSVLNETDERDVIAIKQAFALIAMHFIVCPTSRGKLGKKMLYYVQNVDSLNEQPWVTLAMEALRKGIKVYQDGKGAQRSIGGCVL